MRNPARSMVSRFYLLIETTAPTIEQCCPESQDVPIDSRAAAIFLILMTRVGTARAQGWGWEGWGGWTSTPEGALAQGMGHYYQGAGIFNERTAIANSIDADTLMRWNDYLHYANDEALRRYVARRRENSRNIRAQNDAISTRVRENPTVRDIEMGDALNAAVNQLTDPRVSMAPYGRPQPRSKPTSLRKSRFETRPRRSSSCSATSRMSPRDRLRSTWHDPRSKRRRLTSLSIKRSRKTKRAKFLPIR